MKLAATLALCKLVKEDTPDEVLKAYGVRSLHFGRDYLIPTPFDARVLTSRYPNLLVLPELDRLLASLLNENRSQRPDNAIDALWQVDATLTAYATARNVWERLGLGSSPY